MTYSIVARRPAAAGLGKVFSVNLTGTGPFPVSQTFAADVPYEAWTQEALAYAADKGFEALKPKLPELMQPALSTAGNYVSNTLWPAMQPKLRQEADRAIAIATGRAAVIASALMVTVIGSAIWIKMGRKKESSGT